MEHIYLYIAAFLILVIGAVVATYWGTIWKKLIKLINKILGIEEGNNRELSPAFNTVAQSPLSEEQIFNNMADSLNLDNDNPTSSHNETTTSTSETRSESPKKPCWKKRWFKILFWTIAIIFLFCLGRYLFNYFYAEKVEAGIDNVENLAANTKNGVSSLDTEIVALKQKYNALKSKQDSLLEALDQEKIDRTLADKKLFSRDVTLGHKIENQRRQLKATDNKLDAWVEALVATITAVVNPVFDMGYTNNDAKKINRDPILLKNEIPKIQAKGDKYRQWKKSLQSSDAHIKITATPLKTIKIEIPKLKTIELTSKKIN